MTYAFSQDVPADAALYAKITEGLGAPTPAGLLVHLAIELPEGGLRYIDVWESEEVFATFVDERLHPVVHGLLRDVFGDALPLEPEREPLNVIDVWGPGGRGAAIGC